MTESPLIQKARAFAEEKLQKLPKEYVYHNLTHTREVANAAQKIAMASQLNNDEIESVVVAAWLHDTGYYMGCDQHEKNSSETAGKLLREWGASEKKIEAVQRTILATTMPQNPQDILGKVLCDADLSHLAGANIFECGDRIRQEFATIKNMKFDNEADWLRFNIKFFKSHEYFTQYGREVLQPMKKQNIKKFKERLAIAEGIPKEELLNKKKKKNKDKKGYNPDRGIETMFRTTSENHVSLSGMADTKANILISINTIILSILVSVLFRRLQDYPQLLLPTIMLVFTCLITIVLAILSTRPNIASGHFTREDIEKKKTNLLFFGNFHNVALNDYERSMREMMKDYDYLYGSMIKDIYYLGKVLARKYKFLRLAYTIFMFGFVSSILAFLIAMMMNYQPYDLSNIFGL